MQREALLHLVFPDTFDHALAPEHKHRIASAFASLSDVWSADNDDRALLAVQAGGRASPRNAILAVRRPLQGSLGASRHHGMGRPRALGSWLYELPEFDEEERDYKLEIAERLSAARAALDGEGDWLAALRAGLGGKNNLTPWQTNDSFLKWCEADSEAAGSLLGELWSSEPPDISRFLGELPEAAVSTDGARIAIASLLLTAVDVAEYPVFRPTPFDRASALLGRETAGLKA